MAEHFLFISATSLCIVVILPGISVYLREFFFFFSPPQPSIAFPTVHPSLACVQTLPPPHVPSGKIGEGPTSPIFPEGEGVCTQAGG